MRSFSKLKLFIFWYRAGCLRLAKPGSPAGEACWGGKQAWGLFLRGRGNPLHHSVITTLSIDNCGNPTSDAKNASDVGHPRIR